MLWIKTWHILFMVAWFAGLFYLPRLFVYHALCEDEAGNQRFKIMERKLFYGIMTPSALLTLLFGLGLLSYGGLAYLSSGWLQVKLAMVTLLVIYHGYCGYLLHRFKHNRNTHSHRYYRWFNEIPVLLLTVILIMVVVKPF